MDGGKRTNNGLAEISGRWIHRYFGNILLLVSLILECKFLAALGSERNWRKKTAGLCPHSLSLRLPYQTQWPKMITSDFILILH
jgi:hypothetical protein